MIADLRAVNQHQPYAKLVTVLHSLSTKWDQREVMPPYIEVVAGLFSANVMRKPAMYKPTHAHPAAKSGAQSARDHANTYGTSNRGPGGQGSARAGATSSRK